MELTDVLPTSSKMSFTTKSIAASALILLVSIGVLSFRSTPREEKDREWVAHTHIVIEGLQQNST
jgi:hypothetical protein